MSTVDNHSTNHVPDKLQNSNGNEIEHVSDTMSEKVVASVNAEDRPMEESHPTAPGALVLFTYPALLIIMVLLALFFMTFFNYG